MVTKILSDSQRVKQDLCDDSVFYSSPRFVHHLDASFRSKLTALLSRHIKENSTILDLMSSWVSHLPSDINYKKVIGHGLNQKELEANNQLDTFWVQNLNTETTLPLYDSSVDYILMTAAWQYLVQPELIAEELRRVISNQGELIISFSNRAFWSKSPRIWVESKDQNRLKYISAVLISNGWTIKETLVDKNSDKGILDHILGRDSDPFFAVIAQPLL